ncbi:MAG: hypothetical protein ABMA26_03995 [Limisphaerales bacterium]
MKAAPTTLKGVGYTMLATACTLAFLWHYWLLPWRRAHNLAWWVEHTPRGQWVEIQKRIHRFGLDHDSSIYIGHYGDERWMEWTIRTLKTDLPPTTCGEGQFHLADAPLYISNQRVTKDADWAAWWMTNKTKSQVEWVRDGFKESGLELQPSLTPSNTVALLRLISVKKTLPERSYNAKRWLRFSNFKPTEFDMASVPSEEREAVQKGLVEFALWLGEHKDGPGKLSRGDDWIAAGMPLVEREDYQTGLNLALLLMAGIGLFLVRLGSRQVSTTRAQPNQPI